MTSKELIETIQQLNLPEDTQVCFNCISHCENCDYENFEYETIEFIKVEHNTHGTKEINLY